MHRRWFIFLLLLGSNLLLAAVEVAYRQGQAAVPALSREFRGAWIATVNNIDWPSKPGLPVVEQQKELTALIQSAARLKLNCLIFQVRPTCDALYPPPSSHGANISPANGPSAAAALGSSRLCNSRSPPARHGIARVVQPLPRPLQIRQRPPPPVTSAAPNRNCAATMCNGWTPPNRPLLPIRWGSSSMSPPLMWMAFTSTIISTPTPPPTARRFPMKPAGKIPRRHGPQRLATHAHQQFHQTPAHRDSQNQTP